MQSKDLIEMAIFISGAVAALSIYGIYKQIKLILAISKAKKNLYPGKVNEKRLCKNMHAWTTTGMVDSKGIYNVKVCQLCGFMPETNQMVSAPTLEKIEEHNAQKEIVKKLYSDFLDQEYREIKAYFAEEIKVGVSLEKILHIHVAGTDFNDRFVMYRDAKLSEATKESEKGNA